MHKTQINRSSSPSGYSKTKFGYLTPKFARRGFPTARGGIPTNTNLFDPMSLLYYLLCLLSIVLEEIRFRTGKKHRKSRQKGNVRITCPSLPFGDRLRRYSQKLTEILLRDAFFPSVILYSLRNDYPSHISASLSSSGTKSLKAVSLITYTSESPSK